MTEMIAYVFGFVAGFISYPLVIKVIPRLIKWGIKKLDDQLGA